MLQSLSTVTTLQNLSCCIDLSGSSTTSALPQPYAFYELVELSVSGQFDDLVRFICACQLPRLARLALQITHPPNSQRPMSELFATICQRCNPASLTSVSADFFCDLALPRTSRLMEYFEPFLVLRNISSFEAFFSIAKPAVHDDDLGRFGAAWPRLVSIRIMSYLNPGRGQPSDDGSDLVCPTLAGILKLAQRYPELVAFQIPKLDASTVPDKDAVPLLGPHGLRSIAVKHVIQPPWLQECLQVAMVLDRVFPAIDLVGVPTGGKGWGHVMHFLEGTPLGRESGGLYADLLQGRGTS